MALRVAHGTYTGDGNDNRDITVSPSFVIKAVMIKRANSDGAAFFSIAGMGDLAGSLNSSTVSLYSNRIQSMGTGTFQIGTDGDANLSGQTYYYFCLGGDDTDIVASSYSGNSQDNRQITTDFLPEAVLIFESFNNFFYTRFGGITGDNSINLSGAGTTLGANHIQELNATGFVVGSAINQGSTTYYYLAIKNVSGQSHTASYTGDGSSDRDITAPGFQPDLVFVKGLAKIGVFKTPSFSGANSIPFSANNLVTGSILSFLSTGFDVGDSSYTNENGVTYYYYAIRDNPAPAFVPQIIIS